jgi:hypothetical protein
MLRDVLARLRGEPAFVCDAALATAHVRCVEALRLGASIQDVPGEFKERRHEDGDDFISIRGIDDAMRVAAVRGIDLGEAGMRWADPPRAVAWPGGRSSAP